jgi:prepilin-type N-terminal cleavage/methylation domain-containing protein
MVSTMREQSGFTLIEIAIVLVIIGLLLGGILKGQELINSAKVKNLANDFRNIPVFIYGYQDKFKALPGDDAMASTHVSGATNATTPPGKQGNGVLDGAWNTTTATDETFLFWQHVRLAGLAPGPTTWTGGQEAAFRPTNSEGGTMGIQSGVTPPINGLRGTYVICSAAILGKFVKQLDVTLDDGNTATGSMMAKNFSDLNNVVDPVATSDISDAASYVVCMGV